MTAATETSELDLAHTIRAHEHGWHTESRHVTSTGYVLYVRCGTCGARRVDAKNWGALVPSPTSAELQTITTQ